MKGIRVYLVGLSIIVFAASAFAGPIAKSISIDGDVSEWNDIINNAGQGINDGPSLSSLLDLDYPVQSNGRDLRKFAFTWDKDWLYFYLERQGSTSNTVDIWIYIDSDYDDLMESGEYVLHIDWQGNNRTTDVSIAQYAPLLPGGDSIQSLLGQADGHNLPGLVYNERDLEITSGGTNTGLTLESRVAWSTLGLTSGSPVQFHVASSNGTNIPDQLDDNMGNVDVYALTGGIGLMRNDEIDSIDTPGDYDMTTIFRVGQNPALDKYGSDLVATPGEGALTSSNGSSDDDDFYVQGCAARSSEPDLTMMMDDNRPLIFYEMDCNECTLFLSKQGSNLEMVYWKF